METVSQGKICEICGGKIENQKANPVWWGVTLPYLNGESKFYHGGCLSNSIQEKTHSYKPLQAGDSNGVQFQCFVCSCDELTMDMNYCPKCGCKLDWSEWEE